MILKGPKDGECSLEEAVEVLRKWVLGGALLKDSLFGTCEGVGGEEVPYTHDRITKASILGMVTRLSMWNHNVPSLFDDAAERLWGTGPKVKITRQMTVMGRGVELFGLDGALSLVR